MLMPLVYEMSFGAESMESEKRQEIVGPARSR